MNSPRNRIQELFDTSGLSLTAKRILEAEELRGARGANYARYVFAVLIAVPILFTSVGVESNGQVVNLTLLAFGIFVLNTILHTLVLRSGRLRLIAFFNYVVVVLDYAVIAGTTLAWTRVVSPNNFAFFIKNSGQLYFLLPIISTVFQFRLRLVLFSLAIFLLIHFGAIAYGLYTAMPLTDDWGVHVIGPGLMLEDALTARPAIYGCAALAVSYAILRSVRMLRRVGQAESANASLSRYFSPDLVQEIASRPDLLTGGARQKVTVMFQDIRNFTRMSEGMDPTELSDFLSDLRERLTRAVFANKGTLDKYIGDAIMAIFGTPRPADNPSDDTRNAVRAGLAMLASLRDFNAERIKLGREEIRIGIGLHTGEVFAGNIGFSDRLEYTVIGDAVNTASRIESLCKKLDAEFIISDQVHVEAGDLVSCRKPILVRVKGKEQPLRLHVVTGAAASQE